MSNAATEALLRIVETEPQRIYEAAWKYSASPRGPFGGTVSQEDGIQMCNGFIAALKEGLTGDGDKMRANYIETLTPAFIAQAPSPAEAVGPSVYWNAGFMSALTAALMPALPPELAADALDWLAHWSGRFVADVSRVAHETAAELEKKR